MKWGIIGYGSIGRRHVQNILGMNDECVVLTKNQDCPEHRVHSISELLSKNCDRIIISNPTYLHAQAYAEIRQQNKLIPILIEKPIFDNSQQFKDLGEVDPLTSVAYCLRFHPLIHELKKLLIDQKVLNAQFYVGQYLPNWRPGRDYSQTYSAQKKQGGGALRDLSHEIDLASYLFGELNLKFSFSKKISQLLIDSDDIFQGIFSTEKCPLISVHMNYLDRIQQRFILLHTDQQTIKVDFIGRVIQVNESIHNYKNSNIDMYVEMLKDFKGQRSSRLCSFSEGLHTLHLIEESEKRSL